MAIVLEDPNESRDRRMKILLDTATSAMQIQNQKQQLSQQAQELAMKGQQNQAENTINAGRYLGLSPASQGMLNKAQTESGMRSNVSPELSTPTMLGNQAFLPSQRQQNLTNTYAWNPTTGQLEQTGSVPKGSIVRNTTTPEDISNKKAAEVAETQKAFKEPEIIYLGNIADSRNTIGDLRKGLEEIGVKDPSKFGVIEEETIDSELGPVSLPARFNLVGQYAKDPKYTAMKRKLDRFFNQYRKVITGAQASFQELESLQQAVGSFKDRPGVFFANLGEIEKEMDKALNTRLDIYDDVGRDTTRVRSRYQRNAGVDLDQANKMLVSSGIDLKGGKVTGIRVKEKK